jgi:hypothetical protein
VVTRFTQLNSGWNAEPNAPEPHVHIEGDTVVLEFLANPFQFPGFGQGQLLRLKFSGATRYRLGATNDEGWYRGHCRFSGVAPAWGELYEVLGDLKLDQVFDWIEVPVLQTSLQRHFLFYLRDETFECTANSWRLEQ